MAVIKNEIHKSPDGTQYMITHPRDPAKNVIVTNTEFDK